MKKSKGVASISSVQPWSILYNFITPGDKLLAVNGDKYMNYRCHICVNC